MARVAGQEPYKDDDERRIQEEKAEREKRQESYGKDDEEKVRKEKKKRDQ